MSICTYYGRIYYIHIFIAIIKYTRSAESKEDGDSYDH